MVSVIFCTTDARPRNGSLVGVSRRFTIPIIFFSAFFTVARSGSDAEKVGGSHGLLTRFTRFTRSLGDLGFGDVVLMVTEVATFRCQSLGTAKANPASPSIILLNPFGTDSGAIFRTLRSNGLNAHQLPKRIIRNPAMAPPALHPFRLIVARESNSLNSM